jgi:hypothetical protein
MYVHDGTVSTGSSANKFDRTMEQEFHSSVIMAMKVIVSFFEFIGLLMLQQL